LPAWVLAATSSWPLYTVYTRSARAAPPPVTSTAPLRDHACQPFDGAGWRSKVSTPPVGSAWAKRHTGSAGAAM